MTALAGTDRSAQPPGSGPVHQAPLPPMPRRGGRWLRRLGGVGATLGLTVFGLGAGLWLGSPASAAPPPVEVHMTGDPAGVFAPSTPKKLLDVSHLVPGGSVTGTMQVRDASRHGAGSGLVDAISLTALDLSYEDACPLPTPADCLAASHALASHLTFTLTSTGPRGTGTQTLSLAALAAGASIGTGMRDHDTVTVSLTASLDFAVGNDVQYGSVGFNLGLGLTSSRTGGGGAGNGDGDSQGGSGSAGGSGNSQGQNAGGDGLAPPQVLGSSRVAPTSSGKGGHGNQGDQGHGHQTAGKPGSVLVLGERQSLPNTGVPVGTMLTIGGGILAAGISLLYAARRRSRA